MMAAGCSPRADNGQDSSPDQTPAPPPAAVTVPAAADPTSAADVLAPAAAAPEVDAADTEPAAEPEPPATAPQPDELDKSQPAAAEPVAPPVEPGGQRPGDIGLRPNPLRDGESAIPPPAVDRGPPDRKRDDNDTGDTLPFDPVKENGPIFIDWPKPKLAVVITGRLDGYLEPCGCAGKERMKGGLSRRHSFFKNLRGRRGWPVVAVDVGGLVKGFGAQAEMKFHTVVVDSMRKMGYDAIALGKSDLRLPAGELFSEAANTDQVRSPFVSANVALFSFDLAMMAKQQIVETAGMKLGITAVLGKKYQEEINNPDVEMVDPEVALAEVVPAMKGSCDMLILLAHATMEETIELARKFPEFDLVVTAGGRPEPPPEPTKIEGTETLLVEVGEKGTHAVVLGLYDDPASPIRYQCVPLDSRFAESPEIRLLMEGYQDQLRAAWLDGLGIRPAPHPNEELLGPFVGSKKCESCHEQSYEVWKESGHSKAWKTLVDLKPPRNFDPECVSCHVIGWHPTHHFPYESGFLSEAETPQLVDVGCESCHGPGGAHVEAEMGSDTELQEKLQKAIAITKKESQDRQCLSCHDLDNSPDFDFPTYWPKIEHYEQLPEEEDIGNRDE